MLSYHQKPAHFPCLSIFMTQASFDLLLDAIPHLHFKDYEIVRHVSG